MSRSFATVPPGLMLASLAWWGWRTDLLPWGLALGLALELARHVTARWEIEADGFRRLWNVTVLLFLGAAMYLFFAEGGWGATTDFMRNPAQGAESLRSVTRMGLRFVQWLPLLFYPFVAVHTYSTAGRLPWWTVSPFLARWERGRTQDPMISARFGRGFDPVYPYWGIVLFAASASDRTPDLYFPVLVALVGLGLWWQRSPRYPAVAWILTLLLTAALGYAGQRGVLLLYQRLDQLQNQWLTQSGGPGFDPGGSFTDIGTVARRKPSSRIVLRLRPDKGAPPALLREAVFTRYRSGYWSTSRRGFDTVQPLPATDAWRLAPSLGPQQVSTILRYTRGGTALLALPGSISDLRSLPAVTVQTNALTTTQAEGLPKLASYAVWFGEQGGFDSHPEAEDVDLSPLMPLDRDAIQRVAAELGLDGLSPPIALKRIEEFLLRHFSYSLGGDHATRSTRGEDGGLRHFLLETRSGHCEYFATATTLLLRAAGIPARYVVGYSVQEHRGDGFVVRARHAHAWSLVFLKDRWLEVDNTPGGWAAREAQAASWWEPLYDRLSDGWLAFTLWRQGEVGWQRYAFAVGVAVLAFMAWRELRGGRWRQRLKRSRPGVTKAAFPGANSEFYELERELARRTAPRAPAAPMGDWVEGLALEDAERRQIRNLLQLHYRLRFDPPGLNSDDRARLRSGVSAWRASRPAWSRARMANPGR